MTFDHASEQWPSEIREFVRTSLSESHLSVTDPLCSILIAQVETQLMLNRRARRRSYWLITGGLIAIGVLCAYGGFYVGKSAYTQSLTHAVEMDVDGRIPQDAWVYNKHIYVRFEKE